MWGTQSVTSCSTTTTNHYKGEVVMAIIANKGNDIGVCTCNLQTLELELMQYTDQPTLPCTLTLVYQLGVAEIVLPATSIESDFIRLLRKNLGDSVTFLSVARRDFSEVSGLRYLNHLSCSDTTNLELQSSERYLSVAAGCAIIRYLEYLRKATLAEKSIRVHYRCLSSRVAINRESSKLLQLIEPLTQSVTNSKYKNSRSLLCSIDYTLTQGGRRLLRSNVLMPACNKVTLEARYDSVELLIKRDDKRLEIRKHLTKIKSDFDHLLSNFAVSSSSATATTDASSQTIKHILGLRGVLQMIPSIVMTLEGCLSDVLLSSIEKTLSSQEYEPVRDIIDTYVDPGVSISDSKKSQNSSSVTKTIQVFAIRTGIDGMLDIFRCQYTQVLSNIYKVSSEFATSRQISSLKTQYKPLKGFFLQCEKGDLPKKTDDEIISKVELKKHVQFTTKVLVGLNNRLKECYGDIIQRTNLQLQHLLDAIRNKMLVLFGASEAIALLDLLQSGATHATMTENRVRPKLDEKLHIKQGRHPLLDRRMGPSFIANNTDMSSGSSVLIVSGPNMSGKTTYLIQVALLVVMAHIGIMLPASEAHIPLVNRIFTRLSLDDSLEDNASTFAMEMRETANIVLSADHKSLVIIDELGRGTSNDEGVATALAVIDSLIHSKAMTLFATHFTLCQTLASVYPKIVQNIHFVTQCKNKDSMQHLHQLESGSCTEKMYGITLSKQMELPKEITTQAEQLCRRLSAEGGDTTEPFLVLHTYADRVLTVCGNSNLGNEDLLLCLKRLQSEIESTGCSLQSLMEVEELPEVIKDKQLDDDNDTQELCETVERKPSSIASTTWIPKSVTKNDDIDTISYPLDLSTHAATSIAPVSASSLKTSMFPLSSDNDSHSMKRLKMTSIGSGGLDSLLNL